MSRNVSFVELFFLEMKQTFDDKNKKRIFADKITIRKSAFNTLY